MSRSRCLRQSHERRPTRREPEKHAWHSLKSAFFAWRAPGCPGDQVRNGIRVAGDVIRLGLDVRRADRRGADRGVLRRHTGEDPSWRTYRCIAVVRARVVRARGTRGARRLHLGGRDRCAIRPP